MQPFGLTIEQLGDDAVSLRVCGELDVARAYTFDAELRMVEERNPRLILVDLRELTFMDSTGLARVLAAHRRAGRAGRRFVVVRDHGPVRRLLAMTALERTFEVVSDPADVVPSTREVQRAR